MFVCLFDSIEIERCAVYSLSFSIFNSELTKQEMDNISVPDCLLAVIYLVI